MSIILRAINISKTFPNRQSVINPASLNIKKGEKYVIKGKSGSGKSTLLNILAGFEKPSSGKVLYKNRSLHKMNDNEQSHIRGVSFGFIFQSFHLIPDLSVIENIELPLMFNENEHALRTEELAKKLEIYHLLGKRPFLLSGGEQQRVAIARALITLPEVIFADEPTGNLDDATAEKVIDLLCRLCNNYGPSLVIATHENCLIKSPHFLYTILNGDIEVKHTNV